ncbi:MAG: WbqC family protein [Polaromonas sp.]|uniref:WbqC family protein n=1 Tax=Polaromonas sp. TaxID=1869339 RepID=UPI0027265D2D|nr:WbqC family protein [Polaromonas sp.]MDO9112345.1 WbqC family protein [Polaromonas sp.]MDP1887775.1 WbqC family protein [Polaromonas sp.]
MKKIAIVQSNYIPWKGYFDMIAAVDEFILYDDMQYTRRDWRNRNKIKTPQDLQWLTVPVKVRGKYLQTILETEIDGSDWMETHWKALEQNYRRAPYFAEVAAVFEPIYRMNKYTQLSHLNRTLIEAVCTWLGISTKISLSSDYTLVDGKSERLADLCSQANATEYISGPAARDYMEAEPFSRRGIEVSWFDYAGYPEYPQLWGEFAHGVTILDLLFNCGKDAPRYMKCVGKE